MEIYLRTKFEHDRPSRCRVTAGSEIVLWGMHVRVHTSSDSCKTIKHNIKHKTIAKHAVRPLGTYIPNLGTIGPVVAEL